MRPTDPYLLLLLIGAALCAWVILLSALAA